MSTDPAAFEPEPTNNTEPVETPESVDSTDRHLLDAVIAKTTELLGTDESHRSLEALQEVAQSLAGQPLTIDPVGVALVRASLSTVLSRDAFQDDLWETMTARVTVTLFDDPQSRARLETLWQRLQEGSAT